MRAFIAGLCLLGLCAVPAEAKRYHRHPFQGHYVSSLSHHRHHHGARYARRGSGSATGRPSAWCGWQMRQWFGGGPEYNLAHNWARRGSPSGGPAVGIIVVWRHHVGVIVGGSPGHWIVKSGNDGHMVRARERSVSGATFRRI
jgi:hypothetical protein